MQLRSVRQAKHCSRTQFPTINLPTQISRSRPTPATRSTNKASINLCTSITLSNLILPSPRRSSGARHMQAACVCLPLVYPTAPSMFPSHLHPPHRVHLHGLPLPPKPASMRAAGSIVLATPTRRPSLTLSIPYSLSPQIFFSFLASEIVRRKGPPSSQHGPPWLTDDPNLSTQWKAAWKFGSCARRSRMASGVSVEIDWIVAGGHVEGCREDHGRWRTR